MNFNNNKRYKTNFVVKVLSVTILIVTSSYSAVAAAVVLNASVSKDNGIYSRGHRSNGLGALFSGVTGDGQETRTLVQFDVSAIPAGSTINSVSLQMKVGGLSVGSSGSLNFSTDTFAVHRLTADWGEGTSSAGNLTANGGKGDGATLGDATWFESFYGPGGANTGTNWTNGGDFVSTASDSILIDPTLMAWSGAGVVQDVQDWIDGTHNNYGWLIQGEVKSGGKVVIFHSKDLGSTEPVLVVDYTEPVAAPVPIPSIVWLISSVLLGLLGASRVRKPVA